MLNWLFRSSATNGGRPAPGRVLDRRHKRHTFEPLEERRMLTAVSWIGGATGYWDQAANWSTHTLPGSGDDVSIPAGATVTIQSGDSISIDSLSTAAGSTLTMNGGSLTVNSTTTTSIVAGNFNLSGGSLEGAGNVTSQATVNWTGRDDRRDRVDGNRHQRDAEHLGLRHGLPGRRSGERRHGQLGRHVQ